MENYPFYEVKTFGLRFGNFWEVQRLKKLVGGEEPPFQWVKGLVFSKFRQFEAQYFQVHSKSNPPLG